MLTFATIDFVRKYAEKLQHHEDVDVQNLKDKDQELADITDTHATWLDYLNNISIITEICKSTFMTNHFESKGTTVPRTYFKYNYDSSKCTLSNTGQVNTETTVTLKSGVTKVTKSTFFIDSYDNHYLFGSDSDRVIFDKYVSKEYKYLVMQIKLNTTLTNAIKCGIEPLIVRLNSSYSWIENFYTEAGYADVIDGVATIMIDVEEVHKKLRTVRASNPNDRLRYMTYIYPVVCDSVSSSEFDVEIESIKYDFLTGNETLSVSADFSNYYNKAETNNAIDTAIREDVYHITSENTTVTLPSSAWTLNKRTWEGNTVDAPGTGYGDTTPTPYRVYLSDLDLYDRVFSFEWSLDNDTWLHEWEADGTYVKQTKLSQNTPVTLASSTDYLTFTNTWASGLVFKYTYHKKVQTPGEDYVPSATKKKVMTSSGSVSLEQGVFYHWPSDISDMTVTLVADSNTKIMQSYHLMFSTGSTTPTVTWPSGIKKPNGFSIAANKVYDITILENCMSVRSWDK